MSERLEIWELSIFNAEDIFVKRDYLQWSKFPQEVEIFQIRGHSTTTWTEFCHFLPPPPLRGQFLYLERGQKQTFFDPLPPHLAPL